MTNRTIARLLLAAALGFMLAFSYAKFTSANDYMDGLINQHRAANGKPALVTSPALTALAEQRAVQIMTDFSHNFWWLDKSGCTLGWGENIAYRIPAADDPVLHSFNAFLNSPDHNANMLGDFTHVGTAIFIGPVAEGGGHYSVQLFGKGCDGVSQPLPPTPAPTPVPVPNPPVGQTPQPAVVPTPVQLPDTSMENPK